jgi:multidrug efflux system membrane fusion protein
VAIQRGTGGAFVYVMTPEQTVTVRQVTVGVADGDDVAIESGLKPAERVVVDGADRLREGARVVAQASK